MKPLKLLVAAALFVAAATSLISCFDTEDAGPIQSQQKEIALVDFDRLEMGDAFNVTVVRGELFSIRVSGDRRNLDDLEISKAGTTLQARYSHNRHANRQYTTFITITMPMLKGASFSGATTSTISGFESTGVFDLTLSGASRAQLQLNADEMDINLSGASILSLIGKASKMHAIVSGASELSSFSFETDLATVDASGASKIRLYTTGQLKATASGASDIRYRGNPTVQSSSSGASTIGAD